MTHWVQPRGTHLEGMGSEALRSHHQLPSASHAETDGPRIELQPWQCGTYVRLSQRSKGELKPSACQVSSR